VGHVTGGSDTLAKDSLAGLVVGKEVSMGLLPSGRSDLLRVGGGAGLLLSRLKGKSQYRKSESEQRKRESEGVSKVRQRAWVGGRYEEIRE